jgi:hypothetical protein
MTASVPATATIDVTALSDADLAKLASECLEEFKSRQAEGTMKIRCPACNTNLKQWYEYKPSYTQVGFMFDIAEQMQRTGSPHVHIKSSLKKVPIEHREHTVIGDITNHYSKMMYLGMIQRCTEDGKPLPQFSHDNGEEDDQEKRDDRKGGVPCFNMSQKAIDFLFARVPLQPAIVRVKNTQILEVPENTTSTAWVRDVYSKTAKEAQEREQDWLNRSGKMAIFYPSALHKAAEQMSLFDEDEEE